MSGNTALKISPETGAVPGERIVGIIMPGEGITIYPIFAKALEQFDNQPERWVDLAWDSAARTSTFRHGSISCFSTRSAHWRRSPR